MKTHVTAAVAGLLSGFLAASGSVMPARAADAAPRGPVPAIDTARAAAAQASERAHAVDREAAPLLGTDEGRATQEPSASAGVEDAEPAPGPQAADNPAERYDPARHRDPFRPPSVAAKTVVSASPRTPLERYEIGQLKLVGVVWEGSLARAMVEDSSGLGYIVTAGTPIGSSGGIVRSVEPRRILIEESTTNFYGEKVPREVVMELPQEDRSP